MLNLFQSNQMTSLAAAFCERNAELRDPFEPLTVIVQSIGLGQWLKLKLANHHGIASNVDAVLPATFLWRLYRELIPETSRLDASPFDPARLVWRIMRLLKEHPELSPAVQDYLAGTGDADLRCFQLSTEIASLFDEYLMYRPEWMVNWATAASQPHGANPADHEYWQSTLWKLVLNDVGSFGQLHRAALHGRALSRLSSPDLATDSTGIWRRLSIFGLSTMPELQLQTFEALAQHSDVDIYFLNPCEHYWGDVVSEKDKARRSIRNLISLDDNIGELVDEDYLEVGNPLLSSLGKQAREYLELLLGSNSIQTFDGFERFPEDSGLNIVKNDVLDMTFAGEFTPAQSGPRQNIKDQSIQVHSCHSRLREVEVLHDEILRQFKAAPDFELSDILVMVPDITDYAPFIASVFGQSLHHRIADLGSLESSLILETFLTLLRLPESRLTGPEIMDLLETPAVMRRLEFTADDLETIAYWIGETGIRWEASGEQKQTMWDLPAQDQNTWQFGLDRLLLGFAMSPDNGSWQSVLPFPTSTSEANLIHRLKAFVGTLTRYRELMLTARTWTDWQLLITELLADFLSPVAAEQLDVDLIARHTAEFAEYAALADFEQPVSRALVTETFKRALTDDQSRAGFISGGITFATLVPMRSIPFRMICLMGMNDGDYPREQRPHSFDLMAGGKHKRGDRSKRLDDRYLFLEALLSAQDCFYVSYIGRGVRDDKPRPPSVVVSEWQIYLSQMFDSPPFHQHPLQPFNPHYYSGDERQSFEPVWFNALTDTSDVTKFVNQPLPSELIEALSLGELSAFYRHPGRHFMQQRLGVFLDNDSVELKDAESFELDPLERYQLADGALAELIAGHDLSAYREGILGSGQVLPGPVGEQHLARELARAQSVFDEFSEHTHGQETNLDQRIELDGISLHLRVDNLYRNNPDDDVLDAVRFRAGQLSARQQIIDWIYHLGVNAANHPCRTISIAKGSKDSATVAIMNPLPAETAREHLIVLMDYFRQGACEPMFLPPEASRKLAESLLKGLELHEAITRTVQSWDSDQPGSESHDRVWSRLFRFPDIFESEFNVNAPIIWTPLIENLGGKT